MKRKIRAITYSKISRRIFRRYIFSVLALVAVLFGGFWGSWLICAQFVWEPDDPLYGFLKTLQALSPFFIIIVIVAGLFVFTFRAIKKTVRYLDELTDAAKSISEESDTPVKLSPELYDIQNEMNLVREQTLRNAMLAREAEQRKNDLIVYLAHDLKTPLTSVIGYLTLLRDEPQISPELRARYTGIALDKAERLEDLINEFFDITRFNLTSIDLEMERMNLSRMLEQIASEFEPILAEKELCWNLDIEPDVEIVCDPDKMERVFDNLIRNAVNYSYFKTEISIYMGRTLGDSVQIRVQNHGKTISPDKLDRIFEQFFRLDSSRASSTGGAGLGLAISKEIVEQHGGSIRAESENESITFNVLLPRGL